MVDFGALCAIRKLLSEDKNITNSGIAQNIHLAIPPRAEWPLILLEVEEIWTSMNLGIKNAHARLKFKASVFCQTPSGSKSALIGHIIRKIIDGKSINLQENSKGTIRLIENLFNRKDQKYGAVQQYYEILIRG